MSAQYLWCCVFRFSLRRKASNQRLWSLFSITLIRRTWGIERATPLNMVHHNVSITPVQCISSYRCIITSEDRIVRRVSHIIFIWCVRMKRNVNIFIYIACDACEYVWTCVPMWYTHHNLRCMTAMTYVREGEESSNDFRRLARQKSGRRFVFRKQRCASARSKLDISFNPIICVKMICCLINKY